MARLGLNHFCSVGPRKSIDTYHATELFMCKIVIGVSCGLARLLLGAPRAALQIYRTRSSPFILCTLRRPHLDPLTHFVTSASLDSWPRVLITRFRLALVDGLSCWTVQTRSITRRSLHVSILVSSFLITSETMVQSGSRHGERDRF
jgi:hypothetical protein